jgi:hypothetical protein
MELEDVSVRMEDVSRKVRQGAGKTLLMAAPIKKKIRFS